MEAYISICIIGKNEEKCITRCMEAIKDFGFPIIYTDTGSTDSTVEIASRYTDLIYHFEWCNDFSKARNFCAQKAPTDWIWVIDCDEYIKDTNFHELASLCRHPENNMTIGTIIQRDIFYQNGHHAFSATRLGRIYNRNVFHYEGIIPEQIAPIDKHTQVTYRDLGFSQNHDGYSDPDVLSMKSKRNADLLRIALEDGEDPYLYYQLGRCYTVLGQAARAADAYGRGLELDVDPDLFYVKSMVESYGYSLLDLKEYSTALSFENIYDTFANTADFLFLMGLIYMNNAMFDKAIQEFKKATAYASSTVEGVNSFLAHYNIGVICECLGRTEDALLHYGKCGDYAPALKRSEVLKHG